MSYPSQLYKAQALGNDFVIFADFENAYDVTVSEVKTLCNRHFGLGADGLIRIGTKVGKDGVSRYFMDYANADGSLANMCGNGVRAVAAFLEYLKVVSFETSGVEIITRSGVKTVAKMRTNEYSVNMGVWHAEIEKNFSTLLKTENGEITLTSRYINVGNEHIVSILNDDVNSQKNARVENLSLKKIPVVSALTQSEIALIVKENGVNFEFINQKVSASVQTAGEILMRVYERGVGETLSCGTGICASAISAHLDKLQNDELISTWYVNTAGGRARVDIADEIVVLTGPAFIVGKFEVAPGIEMATAFANEELINNG